MMCSTKEIPCPNNMRISRRRNATYRTIVCHEHRPDTATFDDRQSLSLPDVHTCRLTCGTQHVPIPLNRYVFPAAIRNQRLPKSIVRQPQILKTRLV